MTGDPAFEAGRIIGRLAAAALIVWGAYLLGRYLGRRKDPPGFVSWPVIVAVIMVAIVLLVPRQARSAEADVQVIHG